MIILRRWLSNGALFVLFYALLLPIAMILRVNARRPKSVNLSMWIPRRPYTTSGDARRNIDAFFALLGQRNGPLFSLLARLIVWCGPYLHEEAARSDSSERQRLCPFVYDQF